jgi:hypothetical protein
LKRTSLQLGLTLLLVLTACAGPILKVDKSDEKLRVDAYELKVVIKEIAPGAKPDEKAAEKTAAKADEKSVAKSDATKASAAKPPEPKVKKIKEGKPAKQPKLGIEAEAAKASSVETSEGFVGRRPSKDPFRVGEKVTLSMKYWALNAGKMYIEVLPFVEVNGRKAYHLKVNVKSHSWFRSVYAVDDTAVTYLDYDEMVPLSLSITLKESKQLAETRTFFDWKQKKASYWQKKVTDKGESSKELNWDIPPYSQNVVSAAYYLRTFAWADGKSYALRVSDEGKNSVYRGEVVRREKLKTDLGILDTVVIKPQVQVEGVFQPVGDILVWLTDDDRKFLVRIEAKIKIGTVVAMVESIDKGLDQ